ncbi:AAA family ATPase [Georgenia phoenicis]|uniref:AAA family ATPase n=1 Tax=unclassified Georgenia TaxID=2626815 RepID=UPI0039B05362
MLRHDDPLPSRPSRVLVAGVSGVGKTTLARRIATVTGGAHTEIDALFHGPGWVPRPEFLDDVRALVARDSWTTEWQYADARPLLAERADLLVWLDLPFTTVTLPRLLRRTLRRRLRREVLWNGNVEPPLWTVLTDREHVLRWAVTTRGRLRTRVPLLEEQLPDLTIVRLRSARQVDRWVEGPLRAAVRTRPGEP